MHRVTVGIIARRQPPAMLAVAAVMAGVGDTMGVIDAHVPQVLLPVARVTVRESARVEPAERVMREEERSPECRPERQLDARPALAIDEVPSRREAAVVDVLADRIAGRASREH